MHRNMRRWREREERGGEGGEGKYKREMNRRVYTKFEDKEVCIGIQ